jgi:hypothetical protein
MRVSDATLWPLGVAKATPGQPGSGVAEAIQRPNNGPWGWSGHPKDHLKNNQKNYFIILFFKILKIIYFFYFFIK